MKNLPVVFNDFPPLQLNRSLQRAFFFAHQDDLSESVPPDLISRNMKYHF